MKRHFVELGTDVMSEPITVIGVGDMSGDVFGNGMLLSDQMRLLAAFDHRHVRGPEPGPGRGVRRAPPAVRARRIDLGRLRPFADLGGGGVWPRSAKSILLTPEMRGALEVDGDALTPDGLIRPS